MEQQTQGTCRDCGYTAISSGPPRPDGTFFYIHDRTTTPRHAGGPHGVRIDPTTIRPR